MFEAIEAGTDADGTGIPWAASPGIPYLGESCQAHRAVLFYFDYLI